MRLARMMHVFKLGSYIDAGDEGGTSGVARFINHSRRSPNLVAEVDVLHSRVWFVACLPIAVDDELCFDYGEEYWEALGEPPLS